MRDRPRRLRFLSVALVCAALVGCADRRISDSRPPLSPSPPPTTTPGLGAPPLGFPMRLQQVGFADLNGWSQDDHSAALSTFRVTCAGAAARAARSPLGGGESDWAPLCRLAQRWSDAAARDFFETHFAPVIIDPTAQALVTGYFEPELAARRRPEGAFQTPIHRAPPEMEVRAGVYGAAGPNGFEPLPTRAEIAAGALAGRGLEIAYLDDPVDAFFLQIQGSGRLVFPSGQIVRVGFAGRNGHTYASVGQEMIRRGWATPDTASAGRIRAFYAADPVRGQALLNANASYVFFEERPALGPDEGPIGAMGRPLTAGRSIAVDPEHTPLGAPVWLETNSVRGPLRRLTIAQDTGAAIKGAQRVDFFWGSGDDAGDAAGRMRNPGRVVTLLPKNVLRRLVLGTR